MLRKACAIVNILAFFFLIQPANAADELSPAGFDKWMGTLEHKVGELGGGTFIVGTKVWYETTWDSALLNIYDQFLSDTLAEGGFYNIESKTYSGSGYLAGPVLGYQSRDRRWSFSFAPMVTSHFSQEIKGSVLMDLDLCSNGILIPVTGNMETVVDVTRRDYDFAFSYSLNQFKDRLSFLEYCKLFLGLKYQDISYDFTLTTQVAIFEESSTEGFDFKVYNPTVGFGFVFPVSEDIVTGVQGGIGLTHFSGINVDTSFAFNFEANVSIVPLDKLVVQFGYRFQKFAFKLHPSGTTNSYSSNDTTYGPTLTAVYSF